MYGQGNYVPQFRPAPPTPLSSFQQGPLAPAPFHQGPPITPTRPQPPPSVNQRGPSAPPSHVIPPGPPPPPPAAAAAIYQHGPPVPQPSVPQGGPQPPPSIQQGPPVRIPPPGVLNTGQSYLHPSPVVHVSSQLAPSYPPPPQNSQYPSFIMNQNMQNSTPLIPCPPGPPLSGTSHPDMIRVPLPPRVLPPLPPSQGHMSFNNSLQPPPPGSAHSFQHIRPQHVPPTSSFIPVTPAPFLSSGDAPVDNIHPPFIPPPPPPPPPSSPPPVPPSPPSSTSPLHPDISARCSETPSAIPLVDASNISGHSNSDIGYRLSDSDVVGSQSVDKTICTAQATDAVPACDSNQITEAGTNCRMESLVESRSPYFIPSPPPKPVEEKVQKIELLCHFIAKNGPDFEIMFREKESDNPEFSFLFGGEAGSEAAIAHEYFLWMRKKCSLESKLPDGYQKIESSSKSSEIGSLMQVSESIAADASHSPADSDMDMEDDTVQPDNDRKSGIGGLNSKPVSACNEFRATKEQLHSTQSSVEHSPAKDVLPVLASCSGPYGQAEQEKNKKDSPTFLEDLGPLTASPSAAGSGHTKALDPFTGGGSPFRLIQDYASDDSAEDNDGPCLEHTSPVNVSPLVTKSTQEEKWINLDVNLATSGHSGPERGFKPRSESILASPCMPDVSQEAQRASETTVLDSDKFCKTSELAHYNHGNQTFNDQSASREASHGGDVLQADVDVGPSNRKVQDEDAMQAPVFKVDEFGRLLREDASDSDSDELYHIGRRGKRGRSWSRSRSPHDRRKRRSRSPWRRKGKRSRSRSRSPRKNKSRSRSPAFRRMGDHFGEKMRRDRGQIPGCFDFLRGRCYRGSSCRYLHHNPMNDEPRRYRSRQYLEERQDSRNSALHEENKNIRATIPTDEQVDVIKQEIQPSQDLSVRGIDASGGDVMDEQREVGYVRNDAQPNISSEVAQSLVTVTSEIDHPEISGEAVQACQTHKIQALQEEPTAYLPDREIFEKSMVTNLQSSEPMSDVQNHDSQGETSPCTPSPGKTLVVQQSEAVSSITLPLPGVQNADQVPPQVNNSLISDPSPDVALETMNQPSTGESYPNKSSQTQLSPDTSSLSLSPQSQGFASQSQAAQEQSLGFPVWDASHHTSPPFPQSVNASHVLQPPKEFSVAPMTTNIQFQSAGVERLPPYHAISHNHHAAPPPSSYSISSSVHAPGFNYSHSQPNPIPPRNDLPLMPSVRPYPSQELMDTRFAEIQPRTYLPADVTHRAPLHMEDFRPRSLPMGNQLGQQFGASSFLRDDQFTHPVMTSGNQFLHVPQQDYHMQSQSMMREDHHLALPVQNDVQNVRSIPNQRLSFPFPVQGSAPSSSYALDNVHSQSITFPRESHARQIQSLRTDSVPPREDYITSGNLSSSHHHQQQLPYGMLRSGADGFSVHLGASEKVDSSISGHLANLSNNLPHLPDTGISRFSGSAHYNPFASTFDKPPGSSKFSSNAFRQEFDKSYSGKYDSPFGLIHTPLDLGVAGPGSKHMASLPGSSRFVDQILPRSGGLPLNAPSEEMNSSRNPREASVEGFPSSKYQSVRKATDGDQYDPLFDSIEPSSNVLGTFSHVQEQGSTSIVNKSVPQRAANEDVSRLSGSHRLLDVEENNKQKISMVATVTRSSENDEFGETAVDAEAGAVENESPEPVVGKNWSPSNPIDIANTGAGEIEIDQVPASGKSKKSKDSRSMRLFKIAIADFVKEVLKPSWRQGNMSKEAFKTIVKKTVDKVSGAMKGHQVPKSQAKIDQYVESSQRKLTKLVMGYVDKYVKV